MDHSLHTFHIEEAERAKIIAKLVIKEKEIKDAKYTSKYPTIADVIEGEWDEKVVNIEYLTKCTVEWIQEQHKEYGLQELADIDKSGKDAAVNAILLALEPDCINGTSYSSTWIHSNRKQLKDLNRALVEAYKTDLNTF